MSETTQATTVIFRSTITCPECGHAENETMPTDACQFFYECKSCGTLLRPNQGDCCVYCSFGSMVCPPMQNAPHSKSDLKGCCT
ncbi:MAG: GDCCVxC domain-containing (seleno)protein [Gammaproteobacteria bacterium]|nr:GDCCVxC domain-containing (seleno)protein [Gammaproteobacteria bacterium]